jgi:hypothetical protein
MSSSAARFFASLPPSEGDDAELRALPQRRAKPERKRSKHRPDSPEHARMIAWCDWAAGVVIGLMPLLCHLLLHYAAKSAPDWDDNWAPDLLFITISNSGLVAVTVFTRMLGANLSISSPRRRCAWCGGSPSFALRWPPCFTAPR